MLCAATTLSSFALCLLPLHSTVPVNRDLVVNTATRNGGSIGRRQFVSGALATVFAGSCMSTPAYAAARAGSMPAEIKLLATKAKALREAVRTGAGERRKSPMDMAPGVNNYEKLTTRVLRDREAVLLPLQAALAAYAATASLPNSEFQKQLALQPLLMKGHLLELDQAVAQLQFDQYVSKSTGRTYPGGKVERELEEVSDTIDDFFELAANRPAPQHED